MLQQRHKNVLDINKNIKTKHQVKDDISTDTVSCLNDDILPIPRVTLRTATIIVALLSSLCFWISQYASFTFDDNSAILSNNDLKPETPLLNLFENDFWGTKIHSNLSHKSYRPITVLTYRLNYIFGGGYQPWGFHFINIFLHVINSVLLLRVFSIIFGGIKVDSNGKRLFTAPKASLLSSILFAVHPVHTESVAAVVGRADLICSIFFSISFVCYAKHCHNNADNLPPSWINLVFCILSACIAMFSKEQGITVLGLCIAYDVITVAQINHHNILQKIDKIVKRVCLLIVVTFLLLVCRLNIMGSGLPQFQYDDNPASFQQSVVFRILNYCYLYSINLWLLLNPWWLCFDWAMGCVPIITSFSDARLLFIAVMFFVMISFVVKVLHILDSHLGRCLAFSLAYLIVPFLPAMNIFFRVGFVIAERNLYISSVGFIMIVVIGQMVICINDKLKQIVKMFWIGLVMIFVFRSIHRTTDWLTEMQLFTSGLKVCPLNAKVHYNIGKCNQDNENIDSAVQSYLEAIRLSPNYDQPMNNLGNIFKDKKMFSEAEKYLEMSVKVNPKFSTGWMNLATVKADLKKKTEAEKCYTQAVTHRRKYPDAYYNWGNMYLDLKEYRAALGKYNIAIQQKLDHIQAWQNKILLLGNTGRTEELIKESKVVTKIFPRDANMLYLVGNSLGNANKLEEAEEYMKKSVELDPQNPSAHGNLGVLYHRLQRYEEAEKRYLESLRLNPHNNDFTKENYRKLKRIWKKT